MKPGNAGGGKDPDFWCARDDGDAEVIGLWPANTKIKWPDPSERAVSRGEDVRASCAYAACNGRDIVGLTVKPVGKPDAGNPHVRFDERGRETERCRMAQATAPFLDSTVEANVRAGASWRNGQHLRLRLKIAMYLQLYASN